MPSSKKSEKHDRKTVSGSKDFWIKFFDTAGIPSDVSVNYAEIFVENRIKKSLLGELNKEYLKDMGIGVMGDIMAILKTARQIESILSNVTSTSTSPPTNETSEKKGNTSPIDVGTLQKDTNKKSRKHSMSQVKKRQKKESSTSDSSSSSESESDVPKLKRKTKNSVKHPTKSSVVGTKVRKVLTQDKPMVTHDVDQGKVRKEHMKPPVFNRLNSEKPQDSSQAQSHSSSSPVITTKNLVISRNIVPVEMNNAPPSKSNIRSRLGSTDNQSQISNSSIKGRLGEKSLQQHTIRSLGRNNSSNQPDSVDRFDRPSGDQSNLSVSPPPVTRPVADRPSTPPTPRTPEDKATPDRSDGNPDRNNDNPRNVVRQKKVPSAREYRHRSNSASSSRRSSPVSSSRSSLSPQRRVLNGRGRMNRNLTPPSPEPRQRYVSFNAGNNNNRDDRFNSNTYEGMDNNRRPFNRRGGRGFINRGYHNNHRDDRSRFQNNNRGTTWRGRGNFTNNSSRYGGFDRRSSPTGSHYSNSFDRGRERGRKYFGGGDGRDFDVNRRQRNRSSESDRRNF